MSQLALPLQLADHAVFSSFFDAGNESLVAMLAAIADGEPGPGSWIWGAPSTGKTHLLQAVCDRAGDRAVYLPMAMLREAGPAILDGLGARDIVCIDDIDAVVGQADWEESLFGLCNELFDAGAQLVVSATSSPREAGIALADLASRLQRLAVFHVHELDDVQCVSALQLRSQHRGLDLPDETAQYLMKRSRRDMSSLYRLLDRLDAAALQAKRRLTVPFVRGVLAEDGF